MSTIAVAGGTGKLGRAIVDALVAQSSDVIVLARESTPDKEKTIGARILAASYADVAALTSLLESNSVGTVISTISSTTGPDNELALIKAAELSKVTKRFIPSIWGTKLTKEITEYFPHAKFKIAILDALESTSLEYTAVYTGFFSDFWTPKVPTYISPMALVLDIAANTAAIPGTGNNKVVFTHTWDVAKCVAKLVTTTDWEKASYIIGDKISWNEFLAIVEETKGTKFTVHHDSLETLSQGQITELPSHIPAYKFFPKPVLQRMFAAFGRMFAEDVFDLEPEMTLNEKFQIPTRSVQLLVRESWQK